MIEELVRLRKDLAKILEKLDSIIETLEVKSDKELMESIKRGKEQPPKRDFEEFLMAENHSSSIWIKCKDCGHRFPLAPDDGLIPCPKCGSTNLELEVVCNIDNFVGGWRIQHFTST